MEFALETKNLVKQYRGMRALDGLSLKIPCGSICGLVGANGAGKTTLMSISTGLVKPTSGEINILGDGPFDIETHSSRVTVLPQDSGLPLYTKVESILEYYGQLQGLGRAAARQAAHDALEAVNLYDRRSTLIRNLSHGMLRRLTVAQAFLGNPELIFLDEPMSGLDPREVYNLREFIRSRGGRQTIIVSSHILAELQIFCDYVVFVKSGKLIRQGHLDEVLSGELSMRYELGPRAAIPDIEHLMSQLPGYDVHFQASNRQLVVTCPNPEYRASDINDEVLPLLQQARIPLDQIFLGNDLEQQFLSMDRSDVKK